MQFFVASLAFLTTVTWACDSHNHDHRNLHIDPGVFGHAPESLNDIVYNGLDGKPHTGTRCGTSEYQEPPGSRALSETLVRKLEWSLNIPVKFHVLYGDNGAGNVPQSMIDAQMIKLNNAYAGSGINFSLDQVLRHYNHTAYTGCKDESFKYSYAVDPANFLNTYTCSPGNNFFGYAYYPSQFDESNKRHGVVILDESMPGGSAAPYNEGATLVHEIGHYLGLYHTFHGNSCSGTGDFADDTPAEASPAYGCPTGRDSCPTQPGEDPIHNYMDYTTDACMSEFTNLQIARIQAQVEQYKPSMAANIVDTTTTPTFPVTDTPTLTPITTTPTAVPVISIFPPTAAPATSTPTTSPVTATPTAATDTTAPTFTPTALPVIACTTIGDSCRVNADCCDNKCRGRPGNKICKQTTTRRRRRRRKRRFPGRV